MAKLIANENYAHSVPSACYKLSLSSNRLGSFFNAGVYLALLVAGLFANYPLARAQEAAKAQASRAISPVYPYDALAAGRAGWAEITFTVDYSGRALLQSVVGSSDRAFAMALQAEVDSIEFIPPRRNGQPQMSQTKLRFEFPAQPPNLDTVSREVLTELRKPKPNLCPVEELDSKPEALRQPLSAYPWALRADGESGKAEVEFVVDRNGRVLFPHILSASHEDFGWAAATAVLRWRYKPPTKGGVKVDTRIKETLVYDITKAGSMW